MEAAALLNHLETRMPSWGEEKQCKAPHLDARTTHRNVPLTNTTKSEH